MSGPLSSASTPSLLLWLFDGYLSLKVQALWADASKGEEKSSGAQDGHVVQLKNTCNWKWGNRGGQTPLYPPMFPYSKKNQNPASIKTLELKNFSTTEQAITLNFGAAALQMAYLTHCSVQFYKKEQWETPVRVVPKKERKFHVALGIEFPDYVLAFLSNDLIIQPVWASSCLSLDSLPLMSIRTITTFYRVLLTGFEGDTMFQQDIQDLLSMQFMKRVRRYFVALAFIHPVSSSLWLVCHLFCVSSRFDCPSHTTRLCEAFWNHAEVTHKEVLKQLLG
ncbi:uncharacterized protein LACBIDRAFT_298226 [Laccaria bicolor S238N-H82]|uniref:Predicted protein n=1 Tax=Laccaria bicolor (strain S238N-H82 / ATCC MYA-4686) TaxID=486041 RepID=B0DCI2_LACBS|nr:uncharacterized protein LACBIDRAFT_298226 [Laccaria bicolor S238N-H82]EDR07734.1 predicted protein [Laccaria bicolor S238N-H82]|eukprot:XP_001881523.1 predicted protein [Laccaria bicolor S238N-H82]